MKFNFWRYLTKLDLYGRRGENFDRCTRNCVNERTLNLEVSRFLFLYVVTILFDALGIL